MLGNQTVQGQGLENDYGYNFDAGKIINGWMPFEFAGRKFPIYGGPYRAKPDNVPGVKMAEEIKAPCEIDIPTRDFDVPDVSTFKQGLAWGVSCLMEHGDLYVGCMGGIGRTGLYMAGLAKLMGVENPVGYVRQYYIPHAVETQQQQDYINDLDVTEMRKILLETYAPHPEPQTLFSRLWDLLFKW